MPKIAQDQTQHIDQTMVPTAPGLTIPIERNSCYNSSREDFVGNMKWIAFLFISIASWPAASQVSRLSGPLPDIVIITVDTLRADHLSGYGYSRQTSPNIDGLMAAGATFTRARTVEPLTGPALASMITSLYPHDHGATRNGVPIFEHLPSVTRQLAGLGYRTTAFVSNWTLRNGLMKLGDHFSEYHEIFTRKRWFGMFKNEANAEDLLEEASNWLANYNEPKPFLLWVHFVEPHAPYRFQKDFAKRLGIAADPHPNRLDRYDTEIAFVDHNIGKLLKALADKKRSVAPIIVFSADHGESLGEHGYWGHGRHLYENNLRIPLAITWQGKIQPNRIDAPAMIFDIPSTLLGLVGTSIPPSFNGFDWSPQLTSGAPPPSDRISYFQAHKGAVQTKSGVARGRQQGLLELAIIQGDRKELFIVKTLEQREYDLARDPGELRNSAAQDSKPSKTLSDWALAVERGLYRIVEPANGLSEEDLEKLRALGYIEEP